MNYLWSDAWLLQAIALAARERRATLAEVIASADAVNHALPTSDELHGGLSRLTAGGFVHEIEDRFDLTNLVPAEIRSRIVESGWREGRQTATELLGAEEWTSQNNVGDPRNQIEYPGLTIDRLRAAEREYRRQVRL
jgi:hypothetical protein